MTKMSRDGYEHAAFSSELFILLIDHSGILVKKMGMQFQRCELIMTDLAGTDARHVCLT